MLSKCPIFFYLLKTPIKARNGFPKLFVKQNHWRAKFSSAIVALWKLFSFFLKNFFKWRRPSEKTELFLYKLYFLVIYIRMSALG